ncbi:hypothetical protein [Natronosalvus rutilus]|uniref:Uncharacterized protein n=1 Tax=Natronosalvus rutilus TaxID=2953753 RepID=A0A9E7N7Q4_9EURY|nr:hypothetical protein [Natronosalvus rutilus]UTF52099.1 hypothetical protein NGM29_09790 [Natronosalvus rutilus]
MPSGKRERTLVECSACGTAYAATSWPDGKLQPIGTKNGCRCGSTEFREVRYPETAPQEEEAD